jgi:hypothetical protein
MQLAMTRRSLFPIWPNSFTSRPHLFDGSAVTLLLHMFGGPNSLTSHPLVFYVAWYGVMVVRPMDRGPATVIRRGQHRKRTQQFFYVVCR